ncbi:MAG: hypothetical protein ACOYYJ_04045 [Chloroflexota bacterium]
MKKYPNLLALLRTELGKKSPNPEQIEDLRAAILAQHPTATHFIYLKNGHWIILPAGPDEAIPNPKYAKTIRIPPHRLPLAYCKAH